MSDERPAPETAARFERALRNALATPPEKPRKATLKRKVRKPANRNPTK